MIVYEGDNFKFCFVKVIVFILENNYLREDLGWELVVCCILVDGEWKRIVGFYFFCIILILG